jgi:hypothetical protein
MMNIHKIMREEMDDLEWMDDVTPNVQLSDLEEGREYIARNIPNKRKLGYDEEVDVNGKTFVVLNTRTAPLMVLIQWIDLDDEISRTDTLTLMNDGGKYMYEPIYSSEPISESDDLDWIRDVSSADPLDPQPGYMYRWVGYDDTFDDHELGTDNIVIKKVINDGVYFDTTTNYWYNLENDIDRTDLEVFIRLVKRGDIVFVDDKINESSGLEWIEDIRPSFNDVWPQLSIGDKVYLSGNMVDIMIENEPFTIINVTSGGIGGISAIADNDEMTDKLGVYVFDFEDSDGELVVDKIEPYFDEEYEAYKKEMNESEEDDLQWIKDSLPYFNIDFIIGKQLYYRENDWSDVIKRDSSDEYSISREHLTLGDTRRHNGWVVTHCRGSECILLLNGEKYEGKNVKIEKTRKEVEYFVNTGIWVIEGDDGSLLNESNDLEWMNDFSTSQPELMTLLIDIRDNLPTNLNNRWHDRIEFIHNVVERLETIVNECGEEYKIECKIAKNVLFPFRSVMMDIGNGPSSMKNKWTSRALSRRLKAIKLHAREYIKELAKSGGINHNPLLESGDFDWIEDIKPMSYDSLLGKALYFEPPITDRDYWGHVKGYLKSLGFKCDLYFNFDDGDEDILGLYIQPDGSIIWTSVFFDEPAYQEHINGFAGKTVEVLDGRSILRDNTLNESDDFEWVKDVDVFDSSRHWVIKYTSVDEALKIQEFLFSRGWGWVGIDEETDELITIFEPMNPVSGPIGFYFSEDLIEKRMDRYSGKVWDTKRDEQYNIKLNIPSNEYTLNMLVGMNESEDELSWMDDVPTELTKDTIHLFYNRPFYTNRSENPTQYFLSGGERSKYVDVCWDDGVFESGCTPYEVRGVVKYFKNNDWYWIDTKLNESVDDDWSWADDIIGTVTCEDLKLGDRVCVEHGTVDMVNLSGKCGVIVSKERYGWVTNEFLISFDERFSDEFHDAEGEGLCLNDSCWYVSCDTLNLPENDNDYVKIKKERLI